MRLPFSPRRAAVFAAALILPVAAGIAPSAGADTPTVPVYQVKVLPAGGGEPDVAISPDGRTVLVDGLNANPVTLFRSTDGGATFQKVAVNTPKKGGGDWDMQWADDHTVIAADLSLGTGIYVDRSTDGGLTWTQTTISEDVYDRPWLGVSGQHVYVIAKGFDGIPYCYVSTDGGQTFSNVPIPIYGTGVVPAEAGGPSPTPVDLASTQNAYVDHVATDPTTGDLYVLFGIDGQDTYGQSSPLGTPSRLYVAHLVAGPAGLTQQFDVHPVILGGPGDNFIDGFNWLTIDRSGTLYVLGNGGHAGHQSAWLFHSTDHGQTWSSPVDVGRADGVNVYGSIAAGSPGSLSLVYLHGPGSTPGVAQPWSADVAQIANADTATPTVSFLDAPVGAAVHTADICMDGIVCGLPGFGDNRNLLDFLANAVDPYGNAIAVVPSDGPATGGDGSSTTPAIVVIRQIDGPNVGPGVPS